MRVLTPHVAGPSTQSLSTAGPLTQPPTPTAGTGILYPSVVPDLTGAGISHPPMTPPSQTPVPPEPESPTPTWPAKRRKSISSSFAPTSTPAPVPAGIPAEVLSVLFTVERLNQSLRRPSTAALFAANTPSPEILATLRSAFEGLSALLLLLGSAPILAGSGNSTFAAGPATTAPHPPSQPATARTAVKTMRAAAHSHSNTLLTKITNTAAGLASVVPDLTPAEAIKLVSRTLIHTPPPHKKHRRQINKRVLNSITIPLSTPSTVALSSLPDDVTVYRNLKSWSTQSPECDLATLQSVRLLPAVGYRLSFSAAPPATIDQSVAGFFTQLLSSPLPLEVRHAKIKSLVYFRRIPRAALGLSPALPLSISSHRRCHCRRIKLEVRVFVVKDPVGVPTVDVEIA